MKKNKIIFWVTTVLFSVLMIFSAVNYLVSKEMAEAFKHLGFPAYFRIELAIAKIIGALVLVLPVFGHNIKEWAYAGFGITLVSAAIAHFNVGDGAAVSSAPLIVFLILATSYIYKNKMDVQAKSDS